ncbi:MAG: MarR family transcriptional regulator [Saprospiraceae bacterium]|nr:MarR family transcriptional regulator [Saprospiraceae bacterium]
MKNYYFDNLYYTTTAFSREISSITENAFMDLGLTPSDAYLIMVVNEKPNVQPTEISEKILLAPSTITRMIEKLEKRNIVTRTQEGKYTYVAATSKGKDLYPEILSTWDDIYEVFNRKLTGDTIRQLVEITSEAAKKLKY